MKNKKIPAVSIILYIFAALLTIYVIWTAATDYGYVTGLIKDGSLTFKDNEYSIVNYFVTHAGQHLAYVFIIFALGLVLQKMEGMKKKKAAPRPAPQKPAPIITKTEEKSSGKDSFDGFFEEEGVEESADEEDVEKQSESDED